MKRILITGAEGALGRTVVSLLRSMDKYNLLETSNKNIQNIIKLDITNKKKIKDIILNFKPDILLNLAGTIDNDLKKSFDVNVEASRYICEIALKYNLNMKIILIGSAAEYGLVKESDNPLIENHELRPLTIYALSKAFQTKISLYYASLGVNVIIARVFNLYGPNMNQNLLIGQLQLQIKNVLDGISTNINLGKLTSSRDYISLEEAALQILAIIEKGSSGQIYHVASGKPKKIIEIVLHYLKEANLDFSIVIENNNDKTIINNSLIYANIEKTLLLNEK